MIIGRYSKVSRRIWNDEKVRRLTPPQPCGQSLFVRLLVGPEQNNIPGLFQMWESGLAEALGWDLKGFREAFAEVSREGLAKAFWEVGLVWVPNSINHNEPPNPNVILSWETAWSELPDCELKLEAYQALLGWAKGKGESWANAFRKACPKGSLKGIGKQEQDQDQEQKKEEENQKFSLPPQPSAQPEDPQPAAPAAPLASFERSVATSATETLKAPPATAQAPRGKYLTSAQRADAAMRGGPGTREDVTRLHTEWAQGVGRPGDKLRSTGDDAYTLADAIASYGLLDCLLVAKHASTDGWVNGKLDKNEAKHVSIRYIFGNEETFSRILASAKRPAKPVSREPTIHELKQMGRL